MPDPCFDLSMNSCDLDFFRLAIFLVNVIHIFGSIDIINTCISYMYFTNSSDKLEHEQNTKK